MYLDYFTCFTFNLRCLIFEKDGRFGSWNHDCSIWWLRNKNLFEGSMFYSKFGEITVFKIISWREFFLVGIVLNWYFENWYIDNLRQSQALPTTCLVPGFPKPILDTIFCFHLPLTVFVLVNVAMYWIISNTVVIWMGPLIPASFNRLYY